MISALYADTCGQKGGHRRSVRDRHFGLRRMTCMLQRPTGCRIENLGNYEEACGVGAALIIEGVLSHSRSPTAH